MPFVAITLGAAGAAAVAKHLWVGGSYLYGVWFYADERKFQGLVDDIAECNMALVQLHDSNQPIIRVGEIVERNERLNANLFQLYHQLSNLGVPIPDFPDPLDPRQQVNLIGYLTTLGSFAKRSNLNDAKTMSEFNIQVDVYGDSSPMTLR